MIQVIKYKCCEKIFAACIEPLCYTDNDWLKNLKKYITKGHIVEMKSDHNVQIKYCECGSIPNNDLKGKQDGIFQQK